MILQIGKIIYSLLSTDDNLTKLVNKKIYPLVADADTTFPFIVYRRNSIITQTSKDRLINEEAGTVEIIVASEKYNESITVAEAVTTALLTRKRYQDINVKKIEMLEASEDYIENAFVQKIIFKITI